MEYLKEDGSVDAERSNQLPLEEQMDMVGEMTNEQNAVKRAFNPKESYKLQDRDELMGYLWLKPYHTNLNFNIFVDDGEAYIRDEHPLLLFAEVSAEEYIPISVNQPPQVLDDALEKSISEADLLTIKNFIVSNLHSLVQLANGQISQLEFVKNISKSSIVVSES